MPLTPCIGLAFPCFPDALNIVLEFHAYPMRAHSTPCCSPCGDPLVTAAHGLGAVQRGQVLRAVGEAGPGARPGGEVARMQLLYRHVARVCIL